MHQFLIRVKNEESPFAIFQLVREYDDSCNIYFFRFVNLTDSTLLPNIFRNPARALDWLDAMEFEWEDIT